ncbi:GntR family transcriptional regulator [Pseudooceanicola sp. LIPI14-2-Ac024]|uniref:GntR family transcriptional regulator n=1 Tax=Pseudooceanicola sp. LIPI14-2-Ac024 TaxID=3344875 RepID=UPI0035CFFA50
MTANGGASPAAADQINPGPAWARPIVKESLADVAFRTLREALMEGHLKPGEALHLRPMSQQFGISVTPMREALLRLVSAGALMMDDRGTVTVPAFTRSQVQEIWGIRAELEGYAAAEAASRITAGEIAELKALNNGIVASVKARDFSGAVRGNTRFHIALAAASGQPILVEMIEGLWVRTGPLLWYSYDREAPRWTPSKHLTIIEALEARDAAAARRDIAAEIITGMQGFMKFAEPDPDPPPGT